MGLKFFLFTMTLVAVISDSMLLPFYPQYFAERFHINDAIHVGSYIAAICLTAMLALPVWARVVRKRGTLRLLVYTQCTAGLLSIASAFCDSVLGFWALSLCMIVFKASYLLIYPYIMEDEAESEHAHTIGILSIIVHFGSIAGALSGGFVLQFWPTKYAFLVMAVGDFIQMAICIYVLQAGLVRPLHAATEVTKNIRGNPRIFALGFVMLVFYFSEYQIAPFFVEYWRSISSVSSPLMSALAYAIPAFIALFALYLNRKIGSSFLVSPYFCLPLGIVGLLLQASGQPMFVLVGRLLFGWSIFQITVLLDSHIFENSTPTEYAKDYSTINIFQNIGVLSSSYIAGSLVASHGLEMPFWIAIVGFALTWFLYPQFTRARNISTTQTVESNV